MGWIVEFAVDWIWEGLIYATYKRHGWLAAAAVLLGPFVAIGLLIAIVLTL